MDLNNNIELYECDYTSSFFMFKNSLNILLKAENDIKYKIHHILPNDIIARYYTKVGDISNRIVTPRELGAYFNNLGILLGKLAILFRNPNNVIFEEENKDYKSILDTIRTYFQVLYSSYNKYIEHFENYMISIFEKNSDESSIDRTKYSIIKLKSNFSEIIDFMYEYKLNNKTISMTTIMGLYYLGIHYTIIGALISELAKEESVDVEEFLLKANNNQHDNLLKKYIDQIDQTKKQANVLDIITSNEGNVLYDLFKVLRSLMCDDSFLKFFYSSDPIISHMNENLVIETILENLYRSLLDVFKNEDSSIIEIESEELNKAFYSDVHPILNNIFNLYCYFDPENYFNEENGLKINDTKMPLMYTKTLLNLIQYETKDVETLSTFEFISSKLNINKINSVEIKLFIEKIISSKHDINPNVIFYLLVIASYYRNNIFNKINNTKGAEHAIEVIIMAETVVYALFNEWFNEKHKIYKFDNRISKTDNEQFTEQEILKYEILMTIAEYISASYKKDDVNAIVFEFMPITKLVASLHPEYRGAFHEYKTITPSVVIEEIKVHVKSKLDTVSMADLALNNEMGKRGILPYILLEPNYNHLLEYLRNDNAIRQLFAGLDYSDTVLDSMSSDMKSLLQKIESKLEIKGSISDSPLYEKINTNMTDIWNSDLKTIEKFYLLYGLNYIFIKNYFAHFAIYNSF